MQKLIGSVREIKIPSSSMQRLLNEESRIQFWVFRIKMEIGVGIRKALLRLLLLTLKRYTSSSHPSQLNTVIAPIPTLVSPEMNANLSQAFLIEEVAAALK